MKPLPNPSPEDDHALDALFAAARSDAPDTTRAEFGFETRLLARLEARRRETPAALWRSSLAWRLSPLFAAVVVLLAAWTAFAPIDPAPTDQSERSSDAPAWTATDNDDLGGLLLDAELS